jgi:hypothetical protein
MRGCSNQILHFCIGHNTQQFVIVIVIVSYSYRREAREGRRSKLPEKITRKTEKKDDKKQEKEATRQ